MKRPTERVPHLLILLAFWLLASLAQAVDVVTYLHTDVAGTPLLATDAGGAVVWKENYQPFGGRLNHPPAGDNDQWFAGKPYDSGTGLSYFGARYYDPLLGRFLGIDPAPVDPGDIHGLSKYSYGNNNPYRYVDPDGHSPLDIGFLVYDIGNLAYSIYKGAGVGEAVIGVGLSMVGVVSPVVGTGQALKAARAGEHLLEGGRAVTDGAGVAARGVGEAAYVVTPKGVAIPTSSAELRSNLGKLTEASTNPATSRKFVGSDSAGPLRVRIEKGHSADPNFTGTPDRLHTTDHLHIDRRANGTSGPWTSQEKTGYGWPF